VIVAKLEVNSLQRGKDMSGYTPVHSSTLSLLTKQTKVESAWRAPPRPGEQFPARDIACARQPPLQCATATASPGQWPHVNERTDGPTSQPTNELTNQHTRPITIPPGGCHNKTVESRNKL